MFYGYNDGYLGLDYYEKELDQAYIANQYGFDTYEEYLKAMEDDEGNRLYDEWKES